MPGITQKERSVMLQQLAAQLQDNYGQRITQALAVGLCATLDASWPRADEPLPAASPSADAPPQPDAGPTRAADEAACAPQPLTQ